METRYSKAELLHQMEAAWTQLDGTLERLTPAQMTQIRDPQGWAVKDHLVHIAAWERSVVVYLRGRPRHEGLGVAEDLYVSGDEDAINAAIQARHKDVPLDEALADLREVHDQLLRQIEPMGDDALQRASSDFQPEGRGERDERPIIGMIYGNSAHHFREHQEWIESLIAAE